MRTGYSVKVVSSSKELNKKELLMMKDTSDAIKLDEAIGDDALIIEPEYYAELEIHNEKSSNPDYSKFIVVDKTGQKYVTGSENFWNSFIDICNEMGLESDGWAIKAYRKSSKNYSGKYFLTCSVI